MFDGITKDQDTLLLLYIKDHLVRLQVNRSQVANETTLCFILWSWVQNISNQIATRGKAVIGLQYAWVSAIACCNDATCIALIVHIKMFVVSHPVP